MATYILLSRLTTESIQTPAAFDELNKRVMAKLRIECPEISWIANYTVLGPHDYLDIFEAPDNESAAKVAVIIRSFGHATTEIWPAVPWERFREIAQAAAAAA